MAEYRAGGYNNEVPQPKPILHLLIVISSYSTHVYTLFKNHTICFLTDFSPDFSTISRVLVSSESSTAMYAKGLAIIFGPVHGQLSTEFSQKFPRFLTNFALKSQKIKVCTPLKHYIFYNILRTQKLLVVEVRV